MATMSFLGLLFSCSKYHLLVLLLSTSLFGVALIPVALAFRGFVLACTAAYIASAYPEQGVALTLVVLGLPSLLTVPGLFIVAFDGACFLQGCWRSMFVVQFRRAIPVGRIGCWLLQLC